MKDCSADKRENIQRAILIDPGHINGFGPILDEYSIGMLPVAGKPLVQHWCEHLADAGISDVVVLLNHFPEQVRTLLGNGSRWGLNVHFALLQEELDNEGILDAASGFIKGPTLIAGLHMLPLQGFQRWLEDAREQSEQPISGYIGETEYLWGIIDADWVNHRHSLFSNNILSCHGSACRCINHARELWQANMDILSGRKVDPHPVAFETEPGIMKEHGAQLHKSSTVHAPVQIGENSIIASDSEIGPKVAIGNNVLIDKGCRISRSVIFDKSYVGSFSDISNAVIAGHTLFRIDIGVHTYIDDPMILGVVDSTRSSSVSWSQRITAVLLLLLLSPLLMIRILHLKLQGHPVWQHERLSVPHGLDLNAKPQFDSLDVFSLSGENTKRHKIPWLWQVVCGRLNLLGRTAGGKEEFNRLSWSRELSAYPVGVINLADISMDMQMEDTSTIDENVLIADSYYHAFRNWRMDFNLIGRWIFHMYSPSLNPKSHSGSLGKGETPDAN